MKTLPKLSVKLLCLFFISNSVFSQIDYKGFPEWSLESEGITNYALYTPSNIVPGNLYPIALFMHGCCGDDYVATLRNAVDPPVRMWHNFGKNTQSIPTYIISPATSSGWSQHFGNLKTVIDDLIANHQGDPERVYVTGFSMGGGGTWDIINQYPGFFAAALPMGSSTRGSTSVAKDIPIWTNIGELDGNSLNLTNGVADIRVENGDTRGGDEWVTGVNPRLTVFDGVGHGVQWDAASSQDLVSWAYSKVNDGNINPNIYFNSPDYKEVFNHWDQVILDIDASDADGTITKVETYVNGIFSKTINSAPYLDTISIHYGDNKIEAIAYDNGNKTSTATIIVRTNNLPTLTTVELPNAKQGALYSKQLYAKGNAPFKFHLSDINDELPEGLSLSENGLIKGIPTMTGNYTIRIYVADDDNDSTSNIYSLQVLPKNTDEVIITSCSTSTEREIAISKMQDYELPNTYSGTEINFSEIGDYTGLSYIATPSNDITNTDADYLSFDVDEDVTVYVAYEVKNLLQTSTIPLWLSSYTKETTNEIVAQYRYFDVYSQDFTQGTVTISGPDASSNNADFNYFVMVKKSGTTLNTTPTVTTTQVPDGYSGYLYNEKLTAIDGEGTLTWTLASGSLPYGFTLSSDGLLSGPADTTGTYNFDVQVEDEDGEFETVSLSLTINSSTPIEAVNIIANDTLILMNSASITLTLNNVSNNSSPTQDIDMVSSTNDGTLLSVSAPVKVNDTTFTVTYNPIADMFGTANIYLETTDNNNSDTLTNVISKSITVKVIPFINNAPNCDVIPDQTAGLNNKLLTHYLEVKGIDDGDDSSQYVFTSISASNETVIKLLDVSYDTGTAVISFNPWELGSTNISLTISDDGGTDLGGIDSKTVTFQLTIVDSSAYIGPAIIEDIDLIEMDGFKVYPNPSSDILYVTTTSQDFYSVSLHSISGKLIYKEDYCKSIPVNSINAGIYILSISNKETIIGKEKVIVQ